MNESIENQIAWHKKILKNLDTIIKETQQVVKLIQETDFMKYEL